MMKSCCKDEILLVGNPNTGKTTLFNAITKSDEHIGNWHGVTVEEKSKFFEIKGEKYSLVDLPGIYSLYALSYEEQVAIDYIKSHSDKKIINICDLNNLERNLFLTLCLLEEGFDVVLVVNSTLKNPNRKLDTKKLSKTLGISVVQIDAQKGKNIEKLLDLVTQKGQVKPKKIPKKSMQEDAEDKYKLIEKILASCSQKTNEIYGKSKLDKFLLNRFFAPMIFLGVMALIFYLTFFLVGETLSNILLDFWQEVVGKPVINLFLSVFGKNSWVTMMIDEAIIVGFGLVLSFLPQIVLLYFFLSILEDSGYLSRVAFVFDDMLEKIGLSGKSVYTLLMGFGCSASAIMTARNMDDKRAKIKTVIATPFLSCSARLPIYLAIGGAFFGKYNLFLIFFLYLLGIAVSILFSFVLNKTILKSKNQSFLLELPPYRFPSMKRSLKILWKNTKSFIFRIGSLLISMNIIVWVLSNFSFTFEFVKNGGQSMIESIAKFIAPLFFPLGFASWGIVVCLLVGVVAKEGILSCMILLAGGNLAKGLFSSSSVIGFSSTASVVSFLVFCLLYIPCLSTIAVMFKEIGKKWTFFAIIIEILIAYFISMVFYNLFKLCELFGFAKVILCFVLVAAVCLLVVLFCFSKKNMCNGCDFCRKKTKR